MGILLTNARTTTGRYVYQPYPKFLTHADGRTCVVPDLDAHRAAARDGWPKPEADKPEPESDPAPLTPNAPLVMRRRGRKPKA